MRTAKRLAINIAYAAIAVAITLIVWEVAAAIVGTELILPDIGATFVALSDLVCGKRFWISLGGTIARSLIAFSASFILFFLLFYACSCFDSVRRIAEPIISALRTLPTMAVALLLAIWAGGYVAPVILGAFVVLPQLYSAVAARNSTLSRELTEVCKICGASRTQTFKSVSLASAAAAFPECLPSSLSFGIKAVVAAEILMQTADSLGMLMKLSQVYYETASLIAMTAAAVAVSVAFEYSARAVLKRILKKYYD